ncbi:hypothetical protein [Amycolatopsis taiwanensis]|uniref:Uncharacterized protein n=1 Tax=Amycolatopsis taiwanensis TaxID=342230 RepID=A0A9W6R193_9PSEU|nr:hypothetical protein [Amycolatopsis taiwanensis]GLY66523.1 hypothetical protein Atai01_31420 [Amycolatopsis taiwanensis]
MTTDSQNESVEPAPRRAGAVWSAEDTASLLDGLRNGVTLDALAETLQRRKSALHARCKKMLPPELQTTVLRAEADVILREQLATDPEFAAEANLDHNLRRRWNVKRDEILTQGWKSRRPLAELVEAVPASEIDIAGRLIRLGLAPDSLAVAERLGCAPGGRHVSLHATRDDAHDHFTAITPASADTITATVAKRALGSPHGPVDTLHRHRPILT